MQADRHAQSCDAGFEVARKLYIGRVTISPARAIDLTALVEIEQATGETFRSLGMDLVADDDPGSPEELTAYVEGGRAFVALGVGDRPLGYLLLDIVDDAAHIEQVSVHPDHARQGIGRALIERAAAWATALDLRAFTLTTYVQVPWNGPYYERLGFRYLAHQEETPGLRDIRQHERAAGLDAWPRACMRRSIRPVVPAVLLGVNGCDCNDAAPASVGGPRDPWCAPLRPTRG